MTKLDETYNKLQHFGYNVIGHEYSKKDGNYRVKFECSKCNISYNTFTSIILNESWNGCNKCFIDKRITKVEDRLKLQNCKLIEYIPYIENSKTDIVKYYCKCDNIVSSSSSSIFKDHWQGCKKCAIEKMTGIPKQSVLDATSKFLSDMDYELIKITYVNKMRRVEYRCIHCKKEDDKLADVIKKKLIACKCRENALKTTCCYIFTKGKNKGSRCSTQKNKNSDYCKTHGSFIQKKLIEDKKVLPTDQVESDQKEINQVEQLPQESQIILKINDIEIQCRSSDGMINLTQLAKLSENRLDNYMASNETKAYLEALNKLPEFQETHLIEKHQGGKGGTWAHRLVVYHYTLE